MTRRFPEYAALLPGYIGGKALISKRHWRLLRRGASILVGRLRVGHGPSDVIRQRAVNSRSPEGAQRIPGNTASSGIVSRHAPVSLQPRGGWHILHYGQSTRPGADGACALPEGRFGEGCGRPRMTRCFPEYAALLPGYIAREALCFFQDCVWKKGFCRAEQPRIATATRPTASYQPVCINLPISA